MISRNMKAAFYFLCGPLMQANGFLCRNFRFRSAQTMKVHLGPGQTNYIEGWVNVDANMFTGRCDIWADLRNPLPFRSASVEAFYSHHVIEHLPDIQFHFEEVFRCLKPGGVYRVAGPNGDAAIRKFMESDKQWFIDYPDKRESIGGRFENFIFCRGEHVTILTQSFLEEIMANKGFVSIRTWLPTRESGFPAVFNDCLQKEQETDFVAPHTLVVEGAKPG
jgi:predicted SAM-dependent methyltransferase